MAENNQAEDRYNPPGVSDNDFESMKFSEVESDDLFWLKNISGNGNPPYRKIDDDSGGNTKTRVERSFNSNDIVYQRT